MAYIAPDAEVAPDGEISVSSERKIGEQLESYQHPASDPGFPFTNWVIYRLDTSGD
jgi:hypothetical protein